MEVAAQRGGAHARAVGTMRHAEPLAARSAAARRKASARTNWQHFFDPSTQAASQRRHPRRGLGRPLAVAQRGGPATARAADERSVSLLQLNMSAGVRGDFVRQEDLLIYGGDPEFVQRQRRTSATRPAATR